MTYSEGILTKTISVAPVNPVVGSSSVWVQAFSPVLVKTIDENTFRVIVSRDGQQYSKDVGGFFVVIGAELAPLKEDA